jgi:hypothetical protein
MIVGDGPAGASEGPVLVDFLLRKEFIIVTILLIAFMVVKEFKVKPIKKKYILICLFQQVSLLML